MQKNKLLVLFTLLTCFLNYLLFGVPVYAASSVPDDSYESISLIHALGPTYTIHGQFSILKMILNIIIALIIASFGFWLASNRDDDGFFRHRVLYSLYVVGLFLISLYSYTLAAVFCTFVLFTRDPSYDRMQTIIARENYAQDNYHFMSISYDSIPGCDIPYDPIPGCDIRTFGLSGSEFVKVLDRFGIVLDVVDKNNQDNYLTYIKIYADTYYLYSQLIRQRINREHVSTKLKQYLNRKFFNYINYKTKSHAHKQLIDDYIVTRLRVLQAAEYKSHTILKIKAYGYHTQDPENIDLNLTNDCWLDYVVFDKHGKIINIVRDQYFTLNHRNTDDPNYLIKTGYTMRDFKALRS